MHKKWHRRAIALAAAAALALSACGGDDDDEPSAEEAATCDAAHEVDVAFAALENGEGSPDDLSAKLDAIEANAPEDIADEIALMVEEGRTALEDQGGEEEEGPPDIPSDELFDAYATVADWIDDNCGFEKIEVTAENYKFEGIPDSVDAGTALVRINNESTEFHEIALFKIKDGEERSLEDLLALPEEESAELATPVGSTFAKPDKSGYTTVELEPGRYGAICFVPVGATPEALESGEVDEEAAPHFTEGMQAEFEVEA